MIKAKIKQYRVIGQDWATIADGLNLQQAIEIAKANANQRPFIEAYKEEN